MLVNGLVRNERTAPRGNEHDHIGETCFHVQWIEMHVGSCGCHPSFHE